MQKKIETKNQTIFYKLRMSRRARYVRLSVAHDSSVILTVPWAADVQRAEEFLKAKAAWVKNKLNFFKNRSASIAPKSGKREYRKLRYAALALAKSKVDEWNQFYNFAYNRINIKNQKTRWGSASKKGNLNFNYKIVHLPKELLDYLIVHELCHLKEFNHSKEFWVLVAQIMPNYRTHRRELKNIVK
ncbi:MAG: SprT family zinc-dependent metalloprotease [Patescibacteria group bacterium]